jgi:hypothetical protein
VLSVAGVAGAKCLFESFVKWLFETFGVLLVGSRLFAGLLGWAWLRRFGQKSKPTTNYFV